MDYTKLVITLLVLLLVSFIYQKINDSNQKSQEITDYDLVRSYLLDETTLEKVKKPVLWVHIEYTINARKWKDFYSRNSYDLNQPYMYHTIKSIVDKCSADFHICLIDDKSIQKLIPSWEIDLCKVANPLKSHLRTLAFAKILHKYGGILVPASFICFKSFKAIYDSVENNAIIVGEFISRNIINDKDNQSQIDKSQVYLNSRLMGAKQDSKMMAEYIKHLEYINSKNYTSSYDLLDLANTWLADKPDITSIPSKVIGTKDNDGNVITIDRLMSEKRLTLSSSNIGVYIPADELVKRNLYNWFVYLDKQDVLNANTLITYFLHHSRL